MKNQVCLVGKLLLGMVIAGCGHLVKPENHFGAENQSSTPSLVTEKKMPAISAQDLTKYAYELGMNPEEGLTEEEKRLIYARRKLRLLERGLDSVKERTHYSKVLPLLDNDQEKIDYLTNPSIEGRQAWTIRHNIWSRAKYDKEFLPLVDAQDVTIGMTQDLVRRSWGEPENIEFSGNPIYRNEKWRYVRDTPSVNGYKRERRYVFFEGGRVVGWETE